MWDWWDVLKISQMLDDVVSKLDGKLLIKTHNVILVDHMIDD